MARSASGTTAGFPFEATPGVVACAASRFVATEGQLSLEQPRRDPALVGRHQVGRPKPQSTGFSFDGLSCPLSATPGNDTWRTPGAVTRAAETLAHADNGDIENLQAIDTAQGNAYMPPRPRTVSETLGGWSGTLDEASADATSGGFLTQADKQK
jgi:hypothetical protein